MQALKWHFWKAGWLNLSLTTDNFPTLLKTAEVIPGC